ncbi:reverse transcriptase domain-containing protein [Tanacetum coccineum]
MQKEKEQQDKLKAVKARPLYGNESGRNPKNHEESHYSESKTPTARTEPRRRHGHKYSRSPSPFTSVFRRLKQNRPPSPRLRPRKEGGVFNRLGRKEPSASTRSDSHHQSSQAKGTEVPARKHHHEGTSSRRTSGYSESEDSEGGHWKSKSKRHRSDTYEDDLSQPWTCEERNPFKTRIQNFDFPRTRMPSYVKTYDGSGDPEDHIKLFQSAAKTERWAMPMWCYMFNSTLTRNARVWFDKLPKESIDSYKDLRAAFRENYRQQTKHIKDPVEIHHIKQKDRESTEDFMERYKEEVLDVEGVPECMISGFMHGITHPELIKRLYEKIPRSMDEMYRVTTSFLQGEVAAFGHGRKKAPTPWKQPEGGNKPSFKKGFKNKHRSDRKPDRFLLLTKTPKEIFALEKGKFKAPPPMVTPAEKRDPNKYCEFHADTGHSTDECMQLRKQIDEMIKADGKERPLAILMVQSWEKVAKQKVTQSFFPKTTISFPPLGDEDGTEGPMIIEAEIGGHFVHRIYVDGEASSEILYEHCFVRIRPEIRSQMVPATTYLTGFSGETIWPLGQISLLVKLGDEEHSTSAWMNFMVVRSPSQHNGIIGRPGIRKIRAIPSTAHGMLKFPVEGGTVTLRAAVHYNGSSIDLTDLVLAPDSFVKPGRHDGRPTTRSGAPSKCPGRVLTYQTKEEGASTGKEEVEKLVDAGIMKEVHYHSWLSNPVMVKKHDGSWRMCVDFKDLNKACPQDGYPLSEIDWKVESLCGYPFKCFLDAYKGYHQIKMEKEDEEKMTFITNQGICCYLKMPFGLKNAGATYQHLVDKAFQRQIGRNLEVYVDDLVIKSRTEEEIIRDIAKTFKTLWQINMKLNPKKCTFGMQEGMFLGYKVNTDGLKVCFCQSHEEIHCLSSKPEDKKNATKKSDFQWTQEAETAFKQMKKLIAELPMLTAPKEKEELIIYLAATKEAISAVLMTKREGKQIPVYFCKQAAKKILPSTHNRCNHGSADKATIVKLRNQWENAKVEEESPDVPMTEPEEIPEPWTLFTDGSSCIDGSGAGLILTNPEGVEFTYAMRFRFEATNNEAEYEALIAGLRIAEQMGVKNLQANVDSRLVANQVNGSYVAKESGMVQYLEKVKGLTSNFKEFSIKQVPRSENKKADALSKIASTSFAHLSKQVLVEELKEKSINEKEVLAVVEEEGHTWMTPVYEYLTKEILPENKNKARVVRRKASRYTVINGTLYKKSFLGPWLGTRTLQANYVLREIHEGSCSMHSSPRTKVKFLIVAIDYFTKWIEAKPVATITGNQVKKFVWDNIVCRFGLPGEIVSDNGKQFCENPFKDWCEKLSIRQCFASVKHPQTNGLVERANRSLGEGIKARLDERKAKD